jgi:tRNA 2-thiouridine synthesizing protein D
MESRQSITIVIGDAPYGKERPFSALRFTIAALLQEHKINIFLIEDGVYTGMKNQAPADYPNNKDLLKDAIEKGADVKACIPCCKSRGVAPEDLILGIKQGTINDLVSFVLNSDKTIFF